MAALTRLALRDLRGGLGGLRIFLACIAIGVAAIVGVNSLARSLQDGLAREGRRIVGGDASFSVIHQQLSPEERGWLAARGRLDDIAAMRAMARNAAGDATLADVKAVGPSWPPLGKAEFAPPMTPAAAFARDGDAYGAEVDDILLDRLSLKVGDTFRIGAAQARRSRPDRQRAGPARRRHRLRRARADFAAGACAERARPAGLARALHDAGDDEPRRAAALARARCWR